MCGRTRCFVLRETGNENKRSSGCAVGKEKGGREGAGYQLKGGEASTRVGGGMSVVVKGGRRDEKTKKGQKTESRKEGIKKKADPRTLLYVGPLVEKSG